MFLVIKRLLAGLACLLFVFGGATMGAFDFAANIGWIPFVLGTIAILVYFFSKEVYFADGYYDFLDLLIALLLFAGGITMAVFGLPVAWLPTLIGGIVFILIILT